MPVSSECSLASEILKKSTTTITPTLSTMERKMQVSQLPPAHLVPLPTQTLVYPRIDSCYIIASIIKPMLRILQMATRRFSTQALDQLTKLQAEAPQIQQKIKSLEQSKPYFVDNGASPRTVSFRLILTT
jgi:hypothetical protein